MNAANMNIDAVLLTIKDMFNIKDEYIKKLENENVLLKRRLAELDGISNNNENRRKIENNAEIIESNPNSNNISNSSPTKNIPSGYKRASQGNANTNSYKTYNEVMNLINPNANIEANINQITSQREEFNQKKLSVVSNSRSLPPSKQVTANFNTQLQPQTIEEIKNEKVREAEGIIRDYYSEKQNIIRGDQIDMKNYYTNYGNQNFEEEGISSKSDSPFKAIRTQVVQTPTNNIISKENQYAYESSTPIPQPNSKPADTNRNNVKNFLNEVKEKIPAKDFKEFIKYIKILTDKTQQQINRKEIFQEVRKIFGNNFTDLYTRFELLLSLKK
jgi:hypothetical protein